MTKTAIPEKPKIFTSYEVFIIAILATLQFTVILDFMVLSPLGAILMPTLKITPAQFAMVVSGYAISAGVSGLLAAGFADKYDRKKLLMFFYVGFVVGTVFCALAQDYYSLLLARIFTGIFGGVIGSVSFAIITDLFRMEVRGRVMGFVQMAFAGSQVLGIPLGFYLANRWDWHLPFVVIVIVSLIVGVLIVLYMKPVDTHLHNKVQRNAFKHLFQTVTRPEYAKAFAATTLLATGGFMLLPFGSAFSVNNLGISKDYLPLIYIITGLFSMAAGPFIGKLSDSMGKYKVFVLGSLWTAVVVIFYCNLGITPLWLVIVISVLMFTGVSSRMISSSALISAVPEPLDRGAFMSVNSSVQQISGGIATFVAGLIVVQNSNGKLDHYGTLGYVVVGATLITIVMMYFLDQYVSQKLAAAPPKSAPVASVEPEVAPS
ncbi:MFS transporter [Chryseolinea lacunae]|uniref:MFS transporter n=1 Tax=Chryseolinea lacunae TaxID=2801331 RepID=A0ABS1KQD6_9BACT|nr:MFS transporter [Chryseolinea lacunae]MBL0741685.1 MFS transporter [Chryseolinea lacunae]